jgi:hypothetical protein
MFTYILSFKSTNINIKLIKIVNLNLTGKIYCSHLFFWIKYLLLFFFIYILIFQILFPKIMWSFKYFEFYFTGKYIINKNQISVQDEQKLVKEELQYKDVVYKRNTDEDTKTNNT